jgi:hypothetical protein
VSSDRGWLPDHLATYCTLSDHGKCPGAAVWAGTNLYRATEFEFCTADKIAKSGLCRPCLAAMEFIQEQEVKRQIPSPPGVRNNPW